MPTFIHDTDDGAKVVEIAWEDLPLTTLYDLVTAGDPDAVAEFARRRANPVD